MTFRRPGANWSRFSCLKHSMFYLFDILFLFSLPGEVFPILQEPAQIFLHETFPDPHSELQFLVNMLPPCNIHLKEHLSHLITIVYAQRE